MLARLGKHPNIVGVKLTCGGIAKAARVSSLYTPETFCTLAGQSDWLVPALAVGSTGVITGVAKLYPKVSETQYCCLTPFTRLYVLLCVGVQTTKVCNYQCCMHIYDLYEAGKLEEATAAQIKLAQMEWGFGKGGINGTKFVVANLRGYPADSHHFRKPYPRYEEKMKQAWILDVVGPLAAVEKGLGKRVK
jgi:4-hydroxy-2-oxoglutarate aldolase